MLIQNLSASGILSFGPQGVDLSMRDLNVLIGPNGSGKSFDLLSEIDPREVCSKCPHARYFCERLLEVC